MKTINCNHSRTDSPTAQLDSGQESPQSRQAEKTIRIMEEPQSDLPIPTTVRRVVYDLRVHQIEVEIQNEELRSLQQELEASKTHFKDLCDFDSAGYISVNEQGVIIEGNLTAAILLNVLTETMVGQPFYRFILPLDQDIYSQHQAAMLETAEPQTCNLHLVRRDLPPLWALLATTPVGSADQSPAMYRIMISDINVGMRLSEEKKQLEAKCRNLEKADSLGRMAGGIAHHFNNLLGAVMTNLELAQYGTDKGLELSKNITTAMHAAQRAAEISTSMLTYLRQSFTQREQLDFAAIFRTCLAGGQVDMPNEVDMATNFDADGPSVDDNVNQIHQVLKNMMTNAWESQNQCRGTIHLSMKTIKPEEIPSTYRLPMNFQFQHKLYTSLTVQDTGCGISEPDIENLFDPFYTSKFFGRGLSLPIVMGIVRAHSGFLMVMSKVGRGSLFSIFLPVSGRGFVLAGDRVIEEQEITVNKYKFPD